MNVNDVWSRFFNRKNMKDTRQSEMDGIIEYVDPLSSDQIHKIVSILTEKMNQSTDKNEIKEIEDILEKFVLIDDKGTATIIV